MCATAVVVYARLVTVSLVETLVLALATTMV